MSAKALTRTQIIQKTADDTGLTRNEVAAVLESLEGTIGQEVGANGPGAFNFLGLFKIEKKTKPAREAKLGVPDPFHPGQTYDRKATPETDVIKIRALKKLKEFIV